MYPKGSTRREKSLMKGLAATAFLVLLVTVTGLAIGEATVEFLASVIALLFVVVVAMEAVVLRILLRNKGWL
ncbi:MAG: hypothetical protein KAW41_00815 [Candidatus Diapherotrites archaeon]|nr:hypothetical protein [Candidatus Diapherotrites archaeon]